VDGTRGIAIVRLDRIEKALAEGQPVTADGREITVIMPPWLNDKDNAR
jgi:hypothetical protein